MCTSRSLPRDWAAAPSDYAVECYIECFLGSIAIDVEYACRILLYSLTSDD